MRSNAKPGAFILPVEDSPKSTGWTLVATPTDTPAEPLELSHQRGRIQSSQAKNSKAQGKIQGSKNRGDSPGALGLWKMIKLRGTSQAHVMCFSYWDLMIFGTHIRGFFIKYVLWNRSNQHPILWYSLIPTVISSYFYNILWYHLISYLGRDYWLLISPLRLIAPEEQQCQVAAYPGRLEADPHLVRGKLGVIPLGVRLTCKKVPQLWLTPQFYCEMSHVNFLLTKLSTNPRGSCLTPALWRGGLDRRCKNPPPPFQSEPHGTWNKKS